MRYFKRELASFWICREVTDCSVQNFLNDMASFLGKNLDVFVVDLRRDKKNDKRERASGLVFMTIFFGDLSRPRVLLPAYLSYVLVALTLDQVVNSCTISAEFLCVFI